MADAAPPAPSRIFISYRREDSSGHVLALLPALREHFGAHRIFKDTDNIPPGEDFLKLIKRELESCTVLLAIIGRDWLTVQDPRHKRRRLDNPDDFLRVEVGSALRNERIRVIPVLVERASMPSREDLPPDLSELTFRNALELSDGRWDSDIQLLIQAIERATTAAAPPVSSPGPPPELLELEERRAQEIAAHVAAARDALEARDYQAALTECKRALLLDPRQRDALEILDRARKGGLQRRADDTRVVTSAFWRTWGVRVGAAAAVILATGTGIWYYRQTPPAARTAPVSSGPPPQGVTTSASAPASIVRGPEEEREARLEHVRTTARAQLGSGQRAQALGTALEGLQFAPNDPALLAVVDSLLVEASKAAQGAKAKAIKAGATAHSPTVFAQGVKLEGDARRAREANSKDTATRSFWDAADRFDAAARQANQARLKQRDEERARRAASGPLPTAGPVVDEEKDRTPVAPEQTPAAAPPRPATVSRAEEEARIRGVLDQYERAYDTLNAGGVKAVYPSVTDDLERQFRQFEHYRLEIITENLNLKPDGRSAVARVHLVHFFKPRGAKTDQFERTELFTFEKHGDTWIIAHIQRR